MEKHFCDICKEEIKKWSDTTPVAFSYGTIHCISNMSTTIVYEVCKTCELKIVEAIEICIKNIEIVED